MIMKNRGCIWILVPAIPQQLKCKLQISVESFLKRFSRQSSEALGLNKLAYNQINGALFWVHLQHGMLLFHAKDN